MTGSRAVRFFVHLAVGLLVPLLLLANALLVPEPYSHPLIHVGLAPVKLMPFLEDRALLDSLGLMVFGRVTPNPAPVLVLVLMVFWFFVGLLGSLALSRLRVRK